MSDGTRITDPERLRSEAVALHTMMRWWEVDDSAVGWMVRAKWASRWRQIEIEMRDQAREALEIAGISARAVERRDGAE